MINERTAGAIVERKYPQYKASGAMKLGKGFVVACSKVNGEELNDCFYAVSGDGSKVAEFNPILCIDEFNEALPHAVRL